MTPNDRPPLLLRFWIKAKSIMFAIAEQNKRLAKYKQDRGL